MKKITLALLSFVCALCCTFGLAACVPPTGSGNGNENDNGTGGQKLSETEWQASLTTFATAKNFHIALKVGGNAYGEVKIAGDTYYDTNYSVDYIYQKDGGNYYSYRKNSSDTDWTKSTITADSYNTVVNSEAYYLVSAGAALFGANYSAFEYADGKYTAASLSVNENFALKDIEITVASGAISKIVCTQVGTATTPDRLVTIDGIGTTSITIPDIAGEQKPASVAGTYYMIEHTENGWECNIKNAAIFTDDGTCNANGEGTYEVKENIIIIHFGEKTTFYAVLDGNILWMFDSIEATKDVHNALQCFYNGQKIDGKDAEKINNIFNSKQPEGDEKISEAEWKKCFLEFISVNNFHVAVVKDGTPFSEAKIVGDIYYDTYYTSENIFQKDGSNYYRYRKTSSDTNWSKTTITEEYYNEIVNNEAYYLIVAGAAVFGDNYSEFEYADGKYTAEIIRANENFILKDIEIIIVNGAVEQIMCTQAESNTTYERFVTIDCIGTTEIAIPDIPGGGEKPASIAGAYYMVVQSENGWVPATDFAVILNADGSCELETAGTYEILEHGIIAMSFDTGNYYAVLDGNILWLFETAEDTADIHNAIQHFYNGTEISAADRAKMVEIFGDGVMNGADKQPE